MKHYPLYCNGQWQEGSEGKTFTSYNKASGAAVASFSVSSREDVATACQAARDAFPLWSGLDAESRAGYLMKAAALMRSRQQELSQAEAAETGKPVFDCFGFDTRVSIWAFEYFANLSKEIKGDVIPLGDINFRDFDFVTYEPYGVAAIIAPYNFPLHLLTRSMAPALAAGNTCVIKGSSITPSTAAMMAEICAEAGFPPGVVNLVQGSGSSVGDWLVRDENVDVVGFTGSEEVGRQLLHISAESPVMKRLVLELGGKGGVIVEPDADLDIATSCQIEGFTFNQGEVCCAMTRVIIHESVRDAYLALLRTKLDAIVIGDPLDNDTRMGCLISQAHLQSVDGDVQQAIAQGAKLYYGGKRASVASCPEGPFYQPTVLTDVTEDMEIWGKEVFGPVLCVCSYTDTDEAIRLANSTRFGLGANLFTENLKKAYHIGRQLNAGCVWVNLPNGMHMACPFGGNKNSGQGREYGSYGLHEYLKVKNNMWRMHP